MTIPELEKYLLDKKNPLVVRIKTLTTRVMFNNQFLPLAQMLNDSITPEELVSQTNNPKEQEQIDRGVNLLRYSIRVRS